MTCCANLTYAVVERVVQQALMDSGLRIDLEATPKSGQAPVLTEIDAQLVLSYIEDELDICIPDDFSVASTPQQIIESLVQHQLISL